MTEVKVNAVKDGPALILVDGNVQVALCRCGYSKNKPLCDGAHHQKQFEAAEKELKIL
ncbi:MAG: CDGSH iron-sulfur domain-containing protein [Candidatus Micrarchaeaceae archaeon]|jgi:CDGSH-type Zn-finger protein